MADRVSYPGMRTARCLAINAGSALVMAEMISAISRQPFLFTLEICLVYANVIGCLSYILIPLSWQPVSRLAGPFPWVARTMLLAFIAVTGSFLADVICVTLGWFPRQTLWPEFLGNVRLCLLTTVGLGVLISIYEMLREQLQQTTLELRTKELEKERAIKLATQARLASLESRIHPHFLFNTLNSISALIRKDPQKAELLVERMAALLRFSLDSRQGGLVPLAREMKIVQDYLEIERTRFGSRLRYRLEVPPELGEFPVPPLSVQTLVENSVKYVISTSLSGGEIRVGAEERAGILSIGVSDSGPGFDAEDVPPGHGIENLRDRLGVLFGGEARLTAGKRGQMAFVELLIPQPEAARTSAKS